MQVTVRADYTFSVQLDSYSNPSNALANGSCCEPGCLTACDTNLHFCIRNDGQPPSDPSCSITEFNTGTNPGGLNPPVEGPWPVSCV